MRDIFLEGCSRKVMLMKGGFSFQIVEYFFFDFPNSDSSNTEDADRINREGDEKKQKGLPNEAVPSTDSQNTSCNKKNKEDSEREMTTGDLHHKESSLCTGK